MSALRNTKTVIIFSAMNVIVRPDTVVKIVKLIMVRRANRVRVKMMVTVKRIIAEIIIVAVHLDLLEHFAKRKLVYIHCV